MIHVKYVLPHHRIRREESRENEAKDAKDIASVKTKNQHPPVKTKKMTKLKNKTPSSPSRNVSPSSFRRHH
jgi:hypothetical protein